MGSASEPDDPAAELMRTALGAVEREDWDEAAAGSGKAAEAFLRTGQTRMAHLGHANTLSAAPHYLGAHVATGSSARG